MLEGVHELDGSLGGFNGMSLSGESIDSLSLDLDSLFLGLSLLGVIFSDSSLEGFSALRSADVLNSDVNSLGDNLASDLLVDDYSEGVLVDIKDSASLSVVEFVGHTLVDGTVGNNINVVALSEGSHDL